MKSRIFAFQGSKRRMLLTIPIDSQNSLCEKSTQKWSQSSGCRQLATKFMRVPALTATFLVHSLSKKESTPQMLSSLEKY